MRRQSRGPSLYPPFTKYVCAKPSRLTICCIRQGARKGGTVVQIAAEYLLTRRLCHSTECVSEGYGRTEDERQGKRRLSHNTREKARNSQAPRDEVCRCEEESRTSYTSS